MEKKKWMLWRWLNVLAFAGVIAVNALANLLPIAGVKTEDISQKYANLFSPSDYAFAIWGVIYALIGGTIIYQFTQKGRQITHKFGPWLAINCALNAVWMLLWHYDLIGWSVLCMVGLLATLIILTMRLVDLRPVWQEKWLVGAGFSLYFGWVTVATIANVTTWLVKINWHGFGIAPEIWTIVVLLFGVLLTALVLMRGGRAAFAVAVIWGYGGILARHTFKSGFNMQHGWIMAATVLSLAMLLYLLVRAVRNGFAVTRLE